MQRSYQHTGLILFVIAFSSFLATLNETILNVALNPLMVDFGIDYSTVQWVVTLNMLVIAITIPVAGFLNRRMSTRVLVIGSLAITLVGSLIGAFAPNYPMLLAARIVQAAGIGVTMPVTMALTLAVAPRNKIGSYMGIVSVATVLGPSAGPIASGFVISATGDWHALFVLMSVLIVCCILPAIAFVPDVSEHERPHFDIMSVVLISLALVGIMYGITTLFSGVILASVLSLIVGIAALVLFLRRQRAIEEPLIDLSPFSFGGFRLGALMMTLAFMCTFSMNIVIPLFLQSAMGQSALDAALILLPATILGAICAPFGGRIFDRHGINVLLPVAFTLIMVGTFAVSHLGDGFATGVLTLAFIPCVIGTNIAVSPAQSFALSRLDHHARNFGVTVVAIALQIGGCVGSSLFVGIMSAAQAAQLAGGAALLPAQTAAFNTTVMVVFCVGLLGLALALFTVRQVSAGVVGYLLPEETPIVQNAHNGSDAANENADAQLASSASRGSLNADTAQNGTTTANRARNGLSALLGDDHQSLSQTASAFDAAVEMARLRTGGLPIVDDDNRLIGFITDGDIMRSLSGTNPDSLADAQMFAWWHDASTLDDDLAALRDVKALDLATRDVVSIDVNESIDALIRVLSSVRLKRVPVTQNGRYLGILHRYDLMAYLVERAGAQKSA